MSNANDHGTTATPPPPPPQPLTPVQSAPRRSSAEEARTLVAGTIVASLATLSDDGAPWASLITYGALADGSPVLCVSTLAEHGRNLARDPRASVIIADDAVGGDPLTRGRVTLAGRAERPEAAALEDARGAYLQALPSGRIYEGFSDFDFWVLRVTRVRWVGGYGRMESAAVDDYAAATADPVAAAAAYAVSHLNDDHAAALLAIAQALGGYPDASAARCSGADRYGVDLVVDTPRGRASTRVGFAEPCVAADGLRAATVELARRARA
jgi:putative heme iron utilization protein